MEKKLSFNIILSLKESCLRKVTVILMSKPHILDFFDKPDFEDTIKDYISKLEIPPNLTAQMKKLIRPIRIQISTWITFLQKYLAIANGSFHLHRILSQLCWTNLGTLDYQKMAKMLTRNGIFDRVKTYKLACLFCLEDYIAVLWEKLPEIHKGVFYEDTGPLFHTFEQPPLEFCWPYILKDEVAKLDDMAGIQFGSPSTFNRYAFLHSAQKGNKVAAEYFFLKFTDVEKEISLFKTVTYVLSHHSKKFYFFKLETFPEEKFSETVFYLLSLLSREQQLEIFKLFPCQVFRCLLDWPWRENFFDLPGVLVWTYLLETNNDQLFKDIGEEMTSTNYLSKLFQELFLLSPSHLRKRFVDKECQSGAFSGFFKYQDLETIKVILRNIDSADRKRLLCRQHIFKIFDYLILRGDLNFVELCLQEATLSTEDKGELKDSYLEFLKNRYLQHNSSREKIWELFLRILQ